MQTFRFYFLSTLSFAFIATSLFQFSIIVYPVDSQTTSDSISYVYPKIYNVIRRRRRDINSNVYYEVEDKLKTVRLGNWVLELNADHNLIFTEGFSSQWVNDAGEFDERNSTTEICDYKIGRISNKEKSTVALTICGTEITGFFWDGFDTYFVEPAKVSNNGHVLFKWKNERYLNYFQSLPN